LFEAWRAGASLIRRRTPSTEPQCAIGFDLAIEADRDREQHGEESLKRKIDALRGMR